MWVSTAVLPRCFSLVMFAERLPSVRPELYDHVGATFRLVEPSIARVCLLEQSHERVRTRFRDIGGTPPVFLSRDSTAIRDAKRQIKVDALVPL